MLLNGVIKTKTKTAKIRFLEKRELNLSENIKNATVLKGRNANETVESVLKKFKKVEKTRYINTT
uniref:Uncharacterized protein n=1 Tax=Castor canadensis TaxID=51338 RepID=A0A8C0W0D9_CASCN